MTTTGHDSRPLCANCGKAYHQHGKGNLSCPGAEMGNVYCAQTPPCGCIETYPQLRPGTTTHGPGCKLQECWHANLVSLPPMDSEEAAPILTAMERAIRDMAPVTPLVGAQFAYEAIRSFMPQEVPPTSKTESLQYEQDYTVAELAALLRTKDRHIERLQSNLSELRFWSGKSPAETPAERSPNGRFTRREVDCAAMRCALDYLNWLVGIRGEKHGAVDTVRNTLVDALEEFPVKSTAPRPLASYRELNYSQLCDLAAKLEAENARLRAPETPDERMRFGAAMAAARAEFVKGGFAHEVLDRVRAEWDKLGPYSRVKSGEKP